MPPRREDFEAELHRGADTVVLVSCVKKKGTTPAAAKELYVSPLFRGMRAYAEATRGAWFILSAEHGVLHPEQVIAPYERTLARMGREQREAWSERVREDLSSRIPPGASVIILAGQRYRESIEPFLRARGHRVDVPMTGLTMGQQLRWLRDAKARDHVR